MNQPTTARIAARAVRSAPRPPTARAINLAGIDLNLLVVLEALLQEANVTRAGERVGLSQPAVSNTLNRLRHLLGDPLLERGGRHMRLTARAHALKEPLANALFELRSLLVESAAFDPVSADFSVRLFASDYTSAVLLSELRRSLAGIAPKVQLDIHWTERAQVGELIKQGEIDFAMGSFDRLPGGIKRANLFEDKIVLTAHSDHPALHGDLTLERMSSYPRLGVTFHSRDYTPTERALTRAGGNLRADVLIPHALVGPLTLCDSDLIMLTSERVVQRLGRWLPIGWRPIPFPMDPVRIELVWAVQGEQDPAMTWFRNLLFEVACSF